MAKLGFRTMQEMIGRTDKLRFNPKQTSEKAQLLDFSLLLTRATDLRADVNIQGGSMGQDFELNKRLVCRSW